MNPDIAGTGRENLTARVVTEVLAPAVLIAVQLVAVGWHAGRQAGASPWWGLPAALFAAVIPFTYIVRGVRRGRFADHHIPERELRHVPLLFGAGSVAVGLGLLAVLGAPRELVALMLAGIAGLAVFSTVTLWWKMSIHTGVAGGTVVVLTTVYGPAGLVAAPLVPLIGWARIRLGAHTTGQVVAGALVGALVAAAVFPPLR
jgi:membrane-associated phospholipid phosphatase